MTINYIYIFHADEQTHRWIRIQQVSCGLSGPGGVSDVRRRRGPNLTRSSVASIGRRACRSSRASWHVRTKRWRALRLT